MNAPVKTATLSGSPAVAAERDLRLDLFRGLALWLIFLDHIPSNIVAWITIRNYGFSDATEIFVFISGYTAAFVYGKAMLERGPVVATARIWRRAWTVYIAHMFLFVIFMAEIAYIGASFKNPLYAEEMNILEFLQQPDVTLLQALLLKFKPANMDVLPLYVVLLLTLPLVLWILQRAPWFALIGSIVMWVIVQRVDINFPAYPSGGWYFNPFAWQVLFVLGAWCAIAGKQTLNWILRSRLVLLVAVAYVIFGFAITLTWHLPNLAGYIPRWLFNRIYPIDKTNLDILRLCHFMALAVITVRLIPITWPGLKSPLLRPAILCGQHSLEIFCLGVFLAFTAHFILTEFSNRISMQVTLSVVGILIMVAVSALLRWYKVIEGRRPGQKPPKAGASLAGGEAA
ncbi:OpgC protein [Variibacter gotjawalensis]|uniref:OpgC protein n=1 Tax=Variibacter gotjawalensis TaxID=1333996 RepID=A0A0S3PPU0_9BRAD|nr:OpgC domain-containing protein [Variibacter gotjawalensis]NIK48255.1 hypothetical protein [Variibacter gotjawalensis]RZS50127.1 hypothetical protein EV661_2578 [Variibacter gotjawalensis]BAT57957.1 OpgC protein [Variibacter gotjawalensis]